VVRASRTFWQAIRRGEWKLVEWRDEGPGAAGPGRRLFRVTEDPAEAVDLADREPQRRDELERSLAAAVGAARADAQRYRRGGEAQLSADEIERLRALGYFAPAAEP
jgi:arylsulfatase A-like enzyme